MTLLGKHTPGPDTEIEKSKQFKYIEYRKTPKEKQLGTSLVWSSILLWRETSYGLGCTTIGI